MKEWGPRQGLRAIVLLRSPSDSPHTFLCVSLSVSTDVNTVNTDVNTACLSSLSTQGDLDSPWKRVWACPWVFSKGFTQQVDPTLNVVGTF